jgi:hypothetical protein
MPGMLSSLHSQDTGQHTAPSPHSQKLEGPLGLEAKTELGKMKVVSTPPHCSFFLPLCLGKGRKGERERRGRQRERERERERERILLQGAETLASGLPLRLRSALKIRTRPYFVLSCAQPLGHLAKRAKGFCGSSWLKFP